MSDVSRHYQTLLAAHYSWMNAVPLDEKVAEQQALLSDLGIVGPGLAVDLGSGPGYQTFALANLGFAPVIALDTSEALLAELTAANRNGSAQPVLADIRDISRFVAPQSASVIVCMGDTLTHLESYDDVLALLCACHTALVPGGHLVITYRDLSISLDGLDRIFPVRSDDGRIMTCVLDYAPGFVTVNDIIYVRDSAGWQLQKSSYRKLRISASDLAADLETAGWSVRGHDVRNRMTTIVAQKP